MSPLFRKTDSDGDGDAGGHGQVPSLYELGSQVDEVVKSSAALPLEQFAAQLMSQCFTTEYLAASKITSLSSVDAICLSLLPDNSGESARDPIPDAYFCLQDLVTEAVQLLQNAGLVMERSYKVGPEQRVQPVAERPGDDSARPVGVGGQHRRADPQPAVPTVGLIPRHALCRMGVGAAL